MARPYLIRGAMTLGAVALAVGVAMQPSEETKAPAKSPLVCDFDSIANAMVIRTNDKAETIQGMSRTELKIGSNNKLVAGGVLYEGQERHPVSHGIAFYADFNTKSCRIAHSAQIYGGLTAPMHPDLRIAISGSPAPN